MILLHSGANPTTGSDNSTHGQFREFAYPQLAVTLQPRRPATAGSIMRMWRIRVVLKPFYSSNVLNTSTAPGSAAATSFRSDGVAAFWTIQRTHLRGIRCRPCSIDSTQTAGNGWCDRQTRVAVGLTQFPCIQYQLAKLSFTTLILPGLKYHCKQQAVGCLPSITYWWIPYDM